jgi:hypothetical protein
MIRCARGFRSRPFDGEGLQTAARDVVHDGRITGWLMECASARQLGLTPTGHAARGGSGAPGVAPGNLHLAAGSLSVAELIADIEDGVYVTELIGHGVNGVTGDYSRGASGYRIIKGEIAGPVAEFTVAGNLIDMFKGMTPASDLEWHRTINVPTIRVDGMTIAGDWQEKGRFDPPFRILRPSCRPDSVRSLRSRSGALRRHCPGAHAHPLFGSQILVVGEEVFNLLRDDVGQVFLFLHVGIVREGLVVGNAEQLFVAAGFVLKVEHRDRAATHNRTGHEGRTGHHQRVQRVAIGRERVGTKP